MSYQQIIPLLKADKFEEALQQLEILLREYPNHVPSLMMRGQLLDRSANFPAAQESYERALKLSPRDPQILYLLGTHWMYCRDWGRAGGYLQESLRFQPANPDALANLARVYQQQGEKQKALETMRLCVRLTPGNAEFCQQLGVLYWTVGQSAEALKWFLRAERINPRLENIKGQIGSAYYTSREFLKALPYLEKELQNHPGVPEFLSMLGDAYSQIPQWEKALNCYLQALNGGKKEPWIYYGLGRALLGVKEYQTALEPLKQALNSDLKLVEAHYQLGKAYQALGRREEAAYEQMVFQVLNDSLHIPPPEKKPLTPEEAELKIQCKKWLEENREAEALSALAKSKGPPALSRAEQYAQLGEIYFALNRYEDAQRLLWRALESNPGLPAANACLGAVYFSRGDLEKAENAFQQALAQDAAQPVALLGLAQVEYRQRRWQEAAGHFKKAQTTEPFLLYLMCDNYFQLGETVPAKIAAELFGIYYKGDRAMLEAIVNLLRQHNQVELAERLSRQSTRQ